MIMSFGIWELLVILIIVALLFGTKKLRSMGSDLGGAVKGFRSAVTEAEKEIEKSSISDDSTGLSRVIDEEVESKDEAKHQA